MILKDIATIDSSIEPLSSKSTKDIINDIKKMSYVCKEFIEQDERYIVDSAMLYIKMHKAVKGNIYNMDPRKNYNFFFNIVEEVIPRFVVFYTSARNSTKKYLSKYCTYDTDLRDYSDSALRQRFNS